DKKTGVAYRRVAALEDAGDVGDEYNYCPPSIDRRITNADSRVLIAGPVVEGPVRSILRAEIALPLPRAAAPDRSQRSLETVQVRVTTGAALDGGAPGAASPIVVENRAPDHRLRLLSPPAAPRVETARADTAFDVVTRPARQRVTDRIT